MLVYQRVLGFVLNQIGNWRLWAHQQFKLSLSFIYSDYHYSCHILSLSIVVIIVAIFECSNPESSSFSSQLKTCSLLNFRKGHVFDFNVVRLSKQIWPKTWFLNFWAAAGVPTLLNESCGTEPGN